MSKVRLVVMDREIPPDFSCGEKSVDNLMQGAYAKTIFKQALAYNIIIDGHLVGNCMIKLVRLVDENAEFYEQDQEFIALEISYLAIKQQLQHQGIGTQVLKILILSAKKMASELPIRFLILDAFKDKEKWYTDAGFRVYPKAEDSRYPGTVPMRMDLIDLKAAKQYVNSYI